MKRIIIYFLSMTGAAVTLALIISFLPNQYNILRFEIMIVVFLFGFIVGRSSEFINSYEKTKALEKCAMKGKYDFSDIDELRIKIEKYLQKAKISQDEADFLVAKLDKIDLREKSSM